MKHRLFILIMFLVSISIVSFVDAKTNDIILLGKVIYLDPGHGGVDPGAIYKDLKESDINLEIAKKTQQVLEQNGAIVYLTRYGDYDLAVPNTINRKRSDLSRRGNIINRSNCDLYLSIHLNAETSSTWKGAQMFYSDTNNENEEIAKIFQETFKKHLSTKREYKKKQTLYLSKRVERPGILIEVGFISNPNERYLLKQNSYQQKVANIILEATTNYFYDN
ncbi:MAG: N-acetylmuramoyl-L-alanine amidase CwlD [Firmicutes bacterium]|nr:N-acetylmuramoyl-L-alanine amidase CwlD [Bacillota bacterium]